jgi:hypothetical protein
MREGRENEERRKEEDEGSKQALTFPADLILNTAADSSCKTENQ